ncbi:MAG: YciI family protein [Rhodospirillaceae bacterium]|nr:YciI family protein [Rhodospirillaceae bacterium]
MLFAITCFDKPNALDVRLANRDAHLAFAKTQPITLGGPLLSDDGQSMIGSLLVIEAEDRATVDAILAADPYAKAGLFQSVAVHPFKHVLPQA